MCSLFLWALVGCSSIPTVTERVNGFHSTVRVQGWQSSIVHGGFYTFQSAAPKEISDSTKYLYIYIEGDGLAWLSRYRPSLNPTPIKPLGFHLALTHNRGLAQGEAVVYLGRACQFVAYSSDNDCSVKDWTSGRFSEAVVKSMNQATQNLKLKFRAKHLVLVGYSGGGALATLIASRRNDVVQLITVAGNLDHQRWSQHHQISPLRESLNPVDVTEKLASVRQVHFIGGKDRVVPLAVSSDYRTYFEASGYVSTRVIEENSHHCCWEKQWLGLLKITRDQIGI